MGVDPIEDPGTPGFLLEWTAGGEPQGVGDPVGDGENSRGFGLKRRVVRTKLVEMLYTDSENELYTPSK